jgi:succinate dehydrogenase / fumarate reductase, cytochrome b subunit
MAMNVIANIFKSSLGRKYLMAITGFLFVLFVLGHLAGNLQIFLGREAINRYGHFLQSNPELIWPVRLGLLLALGIHLWAAITLSIENKAARPIPYAQYRPIGSTCASQTMLITGGIVFCFLLYHLLHYTAQIQYLNLTGRDFTTFLDAEKRHDVYKMVIVGFNNGWVCAFYIVGMALLSHHLSHGVSSMFHSLGWSNDAYRPLLERGARILAWLAFLGYVSIPVAILLGYGKDALR